MKKSTSLTTTYHPVVVHQCNLALCRMQHFVLFVRQSFGKVAMMTPTSQNGCIKDHGMRTNGVPSTYMCIYNVLKSAPVQQERTFGNCKLMLSTHTPRHSKQHEHDNTMQQCTGMPKTVPEWCTGFANGNGCECAHACGLERAVQQGSWGWDLVSEETMKKGTQKYVSLFVTPAGNLVNIATLCFADLFTSGNDR